MKQPLALETLHRRVRLEGKNHLVAAACLAVEALGGAQRAAVRVLHALGHYFADIAGQRPVVHGAHVLDRVEVAVFEKVRPRPESE